MTGVQTCALPIWGTYQDGVDANPEDIFRHVEDGGQLPSTSAVNIADYQALFADLSPQYDDVLHITIGSEFSCCYQNALVAAADYPNVRNCVRADGLQRSWSSRR